MALSVKEQNPWDKARAQILDAADKLTTPIIDGFEAIKRRMDAGAIMDAPDAASLIRTADGRSNLIFTREEIDPRTSVRRGSRVSVSGIIPAECHNPATFVSVNSNEEKIGALKVSIVKDAYGKALNILEDKARRILVELPDLAFLENGGVKELIETLRGGVKVNLEDKYFDMPPSDIWQRRIDHDKVFLRAYSQGFFIEVSRARQSGGEYCFTASVLVPDFRPEATLGHHTKEHRDRVAKREGIENREIVEPPLIELMSVGGAVLGKVFDRLEDVAFSSMVDDVNGDEVSEKPRQLEKLAV